jgi:Ca-activated chloride channel family protein
VDDQEFIAQRIGLAKALLAPDVQSAIADAGPHGQIAVSVIEGSDQENQVVVVPWRILKSPADAKQFALTLAQIPRVAKTAGTSITGAIAYSIYHLGRLPAKPSRAVIDISSYGRDNLGTRASAMRDVAANNGITVNGLPITNKIPTLNYYFQRYVIGGPRRVYPTHQQLRRVQGHHT